MQKVFSLIKAHNQSSITDDCARKEKLLSPLYHTGALTNHEIVQAKIIKKELSFFLLLYFNLTFGRFKAQALWLQLGSHFMKNLLHEHLVQ